MVGIFLLANMTVSVAFYSVAQCYGWQKPILGKSACILELSSDFNDCGSGLCYIDKILAQYSEGGKPTYYAASVKKKLVCYS